MAYYRQLREETARLPAYLSSILERMADNLSIINIFRIFIVKLNFTRIVPTRRSARMKIKETVSRLFFNLFVFRGAR